MGLPLGPSQRGRDAGGAGRLFFLDVIHSSDKEPETWGQTSSMLQICIVYMYTDNHIMYISLYVYIHTPIDMYI